MKKFILVSILFILFILAFACQKKTASKNNKNKKTPVVYTTFYPTTYFTQVIGGDSVKVVCPCPEDEDAIFWMPDRDTIAEYQQADLIIINGAQFEKWVAKVSLPRQKMVDTAKEFSHEFIQYENAETHSHGPAGEHTHEGIDGHTWLDPINALIQAQAIKKALDKEFPDLKDQFDRGFSNLEEILMDLEKKLSNLSAEYKNQPILCSHPAYNYLARRYDWNIKNLDLDPEQDLSKEQIDKIKTILKNHKAKYLLWESTPIDSLRDQVKNEFNLTSITFSPCELVEKSSLDEGFDYYAIMNENIESIKPIFQ